MIFVAQAMSASAIMYRQGDSLAKILCMWTSLFLGTGFVAFLTALIFPGHCHTVSRLLLRSWEAVQPYSESIKGQS